MKTTTIQRKSVYEYKLVGAFLMHKKSISRDIIDIQVKKALKLDIFIESKLYSK